MSRGAAATAPRMGGTTSPGKAELIKAARVIVENCGLTMSQNKIVRLVLRFIDRMPDAPGWVFVNYLAAQVQMSEQQKRAALRNPDVARVISYDPTGAMRGKETRGSRPDAQEHRRKCIREVLAAAPPLSDERAHRIVGMLTVGGGVT